MDFYDINSQNSGLFSHNFADFFHNLFPIKWAKSSQSSENSKNNKRPKNCKSSESSKRTKGPKSSSSFSLFNTLKNLNILRTLRTSGSSNNFHTNDDNEFDSSEGEHLDQDQTKNSKVKEKALHTIRMQFLGAAILISSLPQVQAHSVIALAEFCAVFLVLTFKFDIELLKNWALFGGVCIGLMIPQLVPYFMRVSKHFMRICPVWMSQELPYTSKSFFKMWFHGLGFTFVIGMISFPYFTTKKQIIWNAGGLFIWFLANYVWYQPWAYDNSKLLFATWFPFMCASVANVFVQIVRKFGNTGSFYVLLLMLLCCASGILGVTKKINFPGRLWAHDYSKLADWVIKNTEPRDVFMTEQWHANPITTLCGRQSLSGYDGWLVSHGIPLYSRTDAIQNLVDFPDDTREIDTFGVKYVAIFAEAPSDSTINFHPDPSITQWKKVYEDKKTSIYKRMYPEDTNSTNKS